jgi:thymidylate kinase
MGTEQPRVELANRLFGALIANDVAFCAVGDTEQFPHRILSDLDLVVGDADAAKLPRLLFDLARQNGAKLVQVIRHESQAWYFIVAGLGPDGRLWFLHPDFSCGYCDNGRPLLDAVQLLASRRPAVEIGGNPKGFTVPPPASEFIYYLLKKIEKQAVNECQARHLSATYRQDPSGAAAELRRFWHEAEVELIARAGACGDWSGVRAMLPELRAALHDARPISWAAWAREVARVIDRVLQPTGLWVVFLGPDGSGKSTTLNRVAGEIAPAFRHTEIFHLRAPLLGGRQVRSDTDPHGRPRRGIVTSLAQLVVNVVRCWLGYWLRVWPALVRSTFVGFDRYYHDLLVDPRRYRYGGPRGCARLASVLVPKPDLWILLDAPASVIEARKSEIRSEEIERQLLSYRELVSRLCGGYIVDASRSPDEVANRVEQIIIDFLAVRTARRLALGSL